MSRAKLPTGRQEYSAVLQMITGYWVSQIVSSAVDLSLAEHLAEGPRAAAEIASAEGASEDGTMRLMRACASLGLLRYEGDQFASTPLLRVLHGDSPQSLKSFAQAMTAPGHWQTWGLAPAAVRTGGTLSSEALGKSIFDYFAENPAEGALFGAAMTDLSTPVILDTVKALDLRNVRTVVDVGGADGAFVLEILAQNPQLTGTVLDLAHAVPGARAEVERRKLADRVTVQEGNFFEAVPAGDLFLLKYILHDWDDESCVRILKRCRDSMHPGSRMAVVEIALDKHDTSAATLMDLNMLTMLGSRERTVAEFEKLFAAASLELKSEVEVSAPYHLLEIVPT